MHPVKSRITEFEQDAHGHWLARLACGHRRPVRHRPPWQNHPWVLSATGRAEHLGMPMHCRDCTDAGPPADAVEVRRSRTFTETDIPAALRSRHVIPDGAWGRLHVLRGHLRYRVLSEPAHEVHIHPGQWADIAPGTAHAVEPVGKVAFYLTQLGPGQTTVDVPRNRR